MGAGGRAFLGSASRWVPESGGLSLGTLHRQATAQTPIWHMQSGAKTCMHTEVLCRNKTLPGHGASRLPPESDPFVWCASWATGMFKNSLSLRLEWRRCLGKGLVHTRPR